MKESTKQHIEKYIKLLEAGEFDKFFKLAEDNYVPQVTHDIAETLENAGIVPISEMSFIPEGYYSLSQITEYTTPENISSINFKAFSASDIETLHVTGNVKTIAESAFEACDFLEKVVIDEGVRFISDDAFYSCENLEYVSLPKSLTRIGYLIFSRCDNLTSIKFNGTQDDWYNIINNEHINDSCYISKIECTDGVILL